MDRRGFLKTVPALAALAAAASGLAEELAPTVGAEGGEATGAGRPAAPASGLAVPPGAIALVKPQTDGGKSVLAALWERKTIRGISERRLPPQVLSDLLWAAFGVNREKGPGGGVGRTAASASNSQEIGVYAALPEGVYLYEAAPHRLAPVVAGDLRAKAGDARAAKAPVRLIYAVDLARLRVAGEKDAEVLQSYYFVDTGLIAGNVYLFAASQGLAAWFHNCDKAGLAAELKLRPEQRVLYAQTVGYPA
jgi:hypothetical protein